MTFEDAQKRIKDKLKASGWTLSTEGLKIPWAVKEMQDRTIVTLWFKPQAIWYTRGTDLVRHFGSARSMHIDTKELSQKTTEVMNKIIEEMTR